MTRLLEDRLPCGVPLIMGIVNTTPDSFSDGGEALTPGDARARIDELLAAGADIIDIGGESTRPGAMPVEASVQIERTSDAVAYAVSRQALVSIDTTDPQVADCALELGASVVNDVSCLRDGPQLAEVTARHGASLVMMHSRGYMHQMAGFSVCDAEAYGDVVADVIREWSERRQVAYAAGLTPAQLLFDPGLGFHKNARHSLEIISRLEEFSSLGHKVVLGPSRKSFLSELIAMPPRDRVGGTVAACVTAAAKGVALLRVHDVLQVRHGLLVAKRLKLLASATSEPLSLAGAGQ